MTPIPVSEVPYRWIKGDLQLDRACRRNEKGKRVKTIQEWLCLQGHGLKIDGDFGPATEAAVKAFQSEKQLSPTGVVDDPTYAALVDPMLRALTPLEPAGMELGQLTAAYARQHLAQHPLEVGGQNCGPWVRLYLQGNEGSQWPWCAGFACFVMQQAASTLNRKLPLKPSFSCDSLAADAKSKGLFVSEKDLARDPGTRAQLPAGSLFLNRRTSTDWVHTGVGVAFQNELFETIEGNTNDDGDREGYEVCRRRRGYAQKDFIRMG